MNLTNPSRYMSTLAMRVVYGPAPRTDRPYGRPVAHGAEGAEVVRQAVAGGGPLMVTRLGSTELGCLAYYLRWRQRMPLRFPSSLRRAARLNAGIFPVDDASLDRFSALYLSLLPHADIVGVWRNRSEHVVIERSAPEARLVQLEALNPLLYDRSWSAELRGRRVLVVHPFAATIERQYKERRELLFGNPNILPEFDLVTVKAVQSCADLTGGYSSWFDGLEAMREQIAGIRFDVAIIGAGAYGLPLAAYVKQMGHTAVHLGGQTQLLFGIRGRRWEVESPDDIAPLFNEHWARPSAEETPAGAGQVEDGCYW